MTTTNRLLTLNLKTKIVSDQKVENYLNYKGNQINFTDSTLKEFVSELPEFWSNPKDKLTYFTYFEDGTFLCQKTKQVFNFSIRETEEKLYNFTAISDQQLKEFILFLENYFAKIKIKETENFYDEVIKNLSDLSYIKYQILDLRTKSLFESDYMFNSDYVFKNEEDMAEWKKYRQEWRDITEQESWKNNDYVNIALPVSPKPKNQVLDIFQTVGSQLVSSSLPQNIVDNLISSLKENYTNDKLNSVIQNYTAVTLKLEILKSFSKLRLPLGVSLTELNQLANEVTQTSILSSSVANQINSVELNMMSDYLSNVEEKIKQVDEKLTEYQLDFSVTDILEAFAEDMRQKTQELELHKQALELLNDVVMNNGEE